MHIDVEAAGGQIAPIKRAAAQAAQGAERGEIVQAADQPAAAQAFDVDARQRFVQAFFHAAQRQFDAVEMRAAAAGGGKTFAGAGVEHHAQFGAAGADQGGGQGKMGQAVDEIIGAVDRIDHPQPALRVCAP